MNTKASCKCPQCGKRLKSAWNLAIHQMARSNPHCRQLYATLLAIKIGRNE